MDGYKTHYSQHLNVLLVFRLRSVSLTTFFFYTNAIYVKEFGWFPADSLVVLIQKLSSANGLVGYYLILIVMSKFFYDIISLLCNWRQVFEIFHLFYHRDHTYLYRFITK